MLAQFTQGLDQFFRITKSGSSLRTELFSGLRQGLFLAMGGLVVTHMLHPAEMDSLLIVRLLFIYTALLSLILGFFNCSTCLLTPHPALCLAFVSTLVERSHMTWSMVTGMMTLACLTYALWMSLCVTKSLQKALPDPLKKAFFLGLQVMLFLWSLTTMKFLVPHPQTLLALAPPTHTSMTGMVGLILYGLFIWRQWPGGEFATLFTSFLLSLLFADPFLFEEGISHTNTLPHPLPFPSQESWSHILRPSSLPEVLGIALVLIFLFDRTSLLGNSQKSPSSPERSRMMAEKEERRTVWLQTLSILLSPLFGLPLYAPLEERKTHIRQKRTTGLVSTIAGILLILALLKAPSLLKLPPAILAIPVMIGSFRAILEELPSLIAHQEPQIFIPSVLLLLTIPLTYNLAFCASLAILLHTLFSLVLKKAISPTLSFLCAISLVILVF